ncbi:MAG: DUF4332 domain-containing protein [Desulfobacterales bacterium]|nr:DUF4332 domain-containing protein [Desulfobacterales bacterium]
MRSPGACPARTCIPSQIPLLEGLEGKLRALRSAGHRDPGGPGPGPEIKGGPAAVAARTGIPEDYLVVLRRTVEAFRPKPVRLRDYPGIDPGAVAALETAGIRESSELWEAAREDRGAVSAARTGLPAARIEEFFHLSDLSRIPYVGATYARAILEAGCRSVGEVARADPEVLDAAIQAANVRLNLYKTRNRTPGHPAPDPDGRGDRDDGLLVGQHPVKPPARGRGSRLPAGSTPHP